MEDVPVYGESLKIVQKEKQTKLLSYLVDAGNIVGFSGATIKAINTTADFKKSEIKINVTLEYNDKLMKMLEDLD